MRFKDKHEWHDPSRTYSVEGAVDKACSTSYDTRGAAECAQEQAENNTKMLGRLIAELHHLDVLTVVPLLRILGEHSFEVAPGPTINPKDVLGD